MHVLLSALAATSMLLDTAQGAPIEANTAGTAGTAGSAGAAGAAGTAEAANTERLIKDLDHLIDHMADRIDHWSENRKGGPVVDFRPTIHSPECIGIGISACDPIHVGNTFGGDRPGGRPRPGADQPGPALDTPMGPERLPPSMWSGKDDGNGPSPALDGWPASHEVPPMMNKERPKGEVVPGPSFEYPPLDRIPIVNDPPRKGSPESAFGLPKFDRPPMSGLDGEDGPNRAFKPSQNGRPLQSQDGEISWSNGKDRGGPWDKSLDRGTFWDNGGDRGDSWKGRGDFLDNEGGSEDSKVADSDSDKPPMKGHAIVGDKIE